METSERGARAGFDLGRILIREAYLDWSHWSLKTEVGHVRSHEAKAGDLLCRILTSKRAFRCLAGCVRTYSRLHLITAFFRVCLRALDVFCLVSRYHLRGKRIALFAPSIRLATHTAFYILSGSSGRHCRQSEIENWRS